MSRFFIYLVVLLSIIAKCICTKVNCTDNQILAFNDQPDTNSKEIIDNYKCKEIEGKQDLDSIACICGWYENCESYFDKQMPDNETIFVAGIDRKDTNIFTYAVESCKRFTKTNQIPFENSDTQVTVIANINEMRSEILTCTARIRDDAFCYPPNWYPSTAGANHAWIAGLVLGVVLPRKELEPVECEDPEDCVVDGDCYCGGYCAPTTGRCGLWTTSRWRLVCYRPRMHKWNVWKA